MIRKLAINAQDGVIDAKVFTPSACTRALPAVVMWTDIGGLRPCFDQKAQTLADAGYAVLLPNMYYRVRAGTLVPAGRRFEDADVLASLIEHASHLTPDALARDFSALLAAIDTQPEFAKGGIAVVGYCRSGGFALRMAAQHPERVAAVAAFHASRLAPVDDPRSPASVVGAIQARVYFGHADNDDYLPWDQIARMDGALAEAGVHFMTELYKGAGHGYTTQDAVGYDAAADALHFKRLRWLFAETLVS